MKRATIFPATLLVLCLFLPTLSSGEEIEEIKFFYQGKHFLNFSEYQRVNYVHGLRDMLEVRTVGQQEGYPFRACLMRMTGRQSATILFDWLQAHPETWEVPVAASFIAATEEACAE